jgi:tRNA threonylcarbamoyladenosine biosynthesis protein TsaE
MLEIISLSPEATLSIGMSIGGALRPGDVVSLGGELGAGKTCLTQGIARGLGVIGAVTSPTFVLMREYQGRWPLVHLDVYRCARLSELVDLGTEEVFRPDAVSVVEWGDHVEPLLPKDRLSVRLCYHPRGRQLSFAPLGGWVDRLGLVHEQLNQLGIETMGSGV